MAIQDQQQSNHKELPTKLWVVPRPIRGVTVDQYCFELNPPPPISCLGSLANNTVIVLYRTDKKEPALLKTASPHQRKGSIKTSVTRQIPTRALFLQTSLTAKNKFEIIIIIIFFFFFFFFRWLSLRCLQAFKNTHPLVSHGSPGLCSS